MVILRMTSLLLNNCCFCLVFHSKLEEDFLYMAYADIMAKVKKSLDFNVYFNKGKSFSCDKG